MHSFYLSSRTSIKTCSSQLCCQFFHSTFIFYTPALILYFSLSLLLLYLLSIFFTIPKNISLIRFVIRQKIMIWICKNLLMGWPVVTGISHMGEHLNMTDAKMWYWIEFIYIVIIIIQKPIVNRKTIRFKYVTHDWCIGNRFFMLVHVNFYYYYNFYILDWNTIFSTLYSIYNLNI